MHYFIYLLNSPLNFIEFRDNTFPGSYIVVFLQIIQMIQFCRTSLREELDLSDTYLIYYLQYWTPNLDQIFLIIDKLVDVRLHTALFECGLMVNLMQRVSQI